MTDTEKLKFILRAIVTAGGPEQPDDMADEVFVAHVTYWLLCGRSMMKTEVKHQCGCGDTI